MSVSTIIRIYCPKYHINLIYENNKNCRKSILPYPISFEILNIYKIVQFWCYETFSPLWFEPGSGHMWESQVLLTDGQVVFLRVLRFSPTFDERSARYKWNILERAVKPKSKKKKKKKCYETLVTYQTAERCPWNETGASSSLYGSTDQKRTRMCHFEISKYLWSRNTHCSVCTFFWKFICRYRFTIRRLKLFCLSWSFTAQSALVRSCRLGQFT